jgi:hypothetical protein
MEIVSVPAAARLLRVPEWRVRRLVDQLDPPVTRIGLSRVLTPSDLERVEAALRAKGHLPKGGDH